MKFKLYPKRDAIQNYVPLPNEIFCLGLTSGEILVYTYLMFCEDRKTFQCHPSYRTIGNAIGKSKNSVRKYVAGLEEKRLITTEPTEIYTKTGQKHNGTLLYTICPIEEANQYCFEQQMRKNTEAIQKKRVENMIEKYGMKRDGQAV